MTDWLVIESGSLPAHVIMAKDESLLNQLDPQGPSLLHFYDWIAPSLTYGHFIRPDDFLNLETLNHHGVESARRPTGGGIIFHFADFSFSILLSAAHPNISLNPLDNYAYINQKVIHAIKPLLPPTFQSSLLEESLPCLNKQCHSFCMAQPTQYDLIVKEKKIGGAAQRRKKQGLLHQMSISLSLPSWDFIEKFIKDEKVLKAMQQNCSAIFFNDSSNRNFDFLKIELKKMITKSILCK